MRHLSLSIQTDLLRGIGYMPRVALMGRVLLGTLLVLVVLLAVVIPFAAPQAGVDYQVFVDATRGEQLGGYFNPPWFLLPFYALRELPRPVGWALWNLVNLAGLSLALRTFGGSWTLVAASPPLLALIATGNTDGVIAGAAAGMLLALRRERWALAAACWLLLLCKPQLGAGLGLALLWWRGHGRGAAWVVGLTGAAGLLSLLLWPGWIPDTLARLGASAGRLDSWSVDAWGLLGAGALLLLLPPLYLRSPDLTWWAAALLLSLPYLAKPTVLLLLVHPVGVWGWLTYLAWIDVVYSPLAFWLAAGGVYSWRAWLALRGKAAKLDHYLLDQDIPAA